MALAAVLLNTPGLTAPPRPPVIVVPARRRLRPVAPRFRLGEPLPGPRLRARPASFRSVNRSRRTRLCRRPPARGGG